MKIKKTNKNKKTKICTKCKKRKEYKQFCKNRYNKDGYSYTCKKCAKEYVLQRYKENPLLKIRDIERKAEYYKKEKETIPDKIKERNKKNFRTWWLKNKEKHSQRRKNAYKKQKYNIIKYEMV